MPTQPLPLPEPLIRLSDGKPVAFAHAGFVAFEERRHPAWVPEDLRTEGRL